MTHRKKKARESRRENTKNKDTNPKEPHVLEQKME